MKINMAIFPSKSCAGSTLRLNLDICFVICFLFVSKRKWAAFIFSYVAPFRDLKAAVFFAQALFDLENSNSDLKSELKDLFINSAVQIDVAGNRKAIVIYVPYRLRKAYRKVHLRLVRELEKKFSGKDVVLLATRRIVRPPKKGSAAQRPRSRTLTAVHEAMLEDLVYPAEIVGKRTRYRIDGSKISKIFLDPKERNNTEYKLESYAGVYRKLTGKDVVFDFPVTEA
ncbi:40S RIBOSOMAL PROTEIN S7 [Salix koriyanagi]|uniref:40S ribosomal protein S7 n=1 Tax=Salix koriyanagi TaxID=2511006 RepID=A0A9Q0VSR7_9ROSI|nr:40S RIBOSOMAL PROTEIN S7 [Salix koriyanagi]